MAKKRKVHNSTNQHPLGFTVPATKPITVVSNVYTKKEIQAQKKRDKANKKAI